MSQAREQPKQPSEASRPASPKVIDGERLFEGQKEVWIDHEGVRYRLRITRRNKLILQK